MFSSVAHDWPQKTVEPAAPGRIALPAGPGTALGVAAVVRQEQDERVIEHAALLERRDQPPHRRVHVRHASGVDGHDVIEAVLLRLAQRVPRRHLVGARRERPGFVHHAEFLLPGVALLAELVPADLVLAAELGDLVRRRLQREMRRVIGQVEQEGLLGRERLVNELDAEIGIKVGGVPVLRQLRRIIGQRLAVEEKPVPLALGVVEAALRGVEAALEAAFPGNDAVLLPHVPFAAHGGEIARPAQHLAKGDAAVVEPPAIARHAAVLDHVPHAGLMRIKPGEDRSARRAAAAGVIELGEAQTVGRQLVEVGRRDLAAVAADVREAHVVHQDDNDVGSGRSRGGHGGRLQEHGGGSDHERSSVQVRLHANAPEATPDGEVAKLQINLCRVQRHWRQQCLIYKERLCRGVVK